MDAETYKEKISFRLSGLNIFVSVGITVIMFILLTTILIAFTPLREWIPGYTDTKTIEQTYTNARLIDSLSEKVTNQEWMIATLQAVMRGEDFPMDIDTATSHHDINFQQVVDNYRHSEADKELRAEFETQHPYTVASDSAANNLVRPLQGSIVAHFAPKDNQYGIVISGGNNLGINAIDDGVVTTVTTNTNGMVTVVLQHNDNAMSIYQYNGVCYKKQGNSIQTGQTLGRTGRREGENTLHLEIWVEGIPINPEELISF